MQNTQQEQYRAIAALLQYPDPVWLKIIPEVKAYLMRLPAGRPRETMFRFTDYLTSHALLDLQENYTTVFDLNPATTMNMSYHLYGDDRKRTAMLMRLKQNYRCAGYEGPAYDLPDFLPAMVELLGVCNDAAALQIVWQCLGGLDKLVHRLRDAAPAYADLLSLLAEDRRNRQKKAGVPPQSDAGWSGNDGKSGTAHTVSAKME